MHEELKQIISQAISQRAELEQKLIEKAWKDETFKQELIGNPKAVISQESGLQIPENLEIEVLQETANKAYFVLPEAPAQVGTDRELSEADLETVAGGINVCVFVTSVSQCIRRSKTHNAADLV